LYNDFEAREKACDVDDLCLLVEGDLLGSWYAAKLHVVEPWAWASVFITGAILRGSRYRLKWMRLVPQGAPCIPWNGEYPYSLYKLNIAFSFSSIDAQVPIIDVH
jgi:hypothetical protein